ncbi:MAG: hypothetical protein JSU61_12535 [Fidelibacterota bacterium]|nr:MAG: hypothetical protein JSU61_12535 [Candidatus Neomarinimicrobiota bacterium]
MIRPILSMVCLMCFSADIYAQAIGQKEQDIKIIFDDSAARLVLEAPVNALTARDSIWNTFEGYRITRVWHEKSSFPFNWEIWDRGLDRFINKDTSLIGKSLELSNGLNGLEKREHVKIVQHLSSYLPVTATFDAYVYIVAFTTPYAFCVEKNKIGIDITGEEWHHDPVCLLNMMIHELYHVGYKLNSPDREYINADPTNGEEFIRFNYAYMLSEGMATYVAYKALDLFPTDYKHEDYELLEDGDRVRSAISGVNQLLEKARTETMDNLLKQAWDTGVTERAYYVAGAYVCKTIAEKYGTEYLSEMVSQGGRNFIREYNTLVPADLNIRLL